MDKREKKNWNAGGNINMVKHLTDTESQMLSGPGYSFSFV